MNETYQNRITDQICKIQTDKKLIAVFTTNCLLLPITPLPSYTLKENMWKMDTRHTLSLGFPFRITPVVQEIGISLPDFISHQSKSNFS